MKLIKDYDCVIDYHPGKANVVADALSRNSAQTLQALNAHLSLSDEGAIVAELIAKTEFVESSPIGRAVHRSKTGPDRTGTGLDRNRNHVFWRTGDRTGIIPVQTCPDLFIQVRSGFGPVWTCFVFFNICSLKSQKLHNKFSS